MSELPPLPAIRVFEAVARLGSFTRAGEELNMTQAAVSYQIAQLERHVGTALFTRLARGVALTSKGLAVLPVVQRALQDITGTFRNLRAENAAVLTISTMQTFAGSWLAPRLGRFQLEHPEYAIRLLISPDLVDLESADVDLVIRSGKGKWKGLLSHKLMAQHFTPVCSPHYLEREGRPATPADILRHVMIDRNDAWWPIWFGKSGVDCSGDVGRKSIDVDTQQMAATLAIAGSGIALVTPAFVAGDLQSGRLVQLFDIVAESGADYYFAYLETRRLETKVKTFREWILQEAKSAGAPLALNTHVTES